MKRGIAFLLGIFAAVAAAEEPNLTCGIPQRNVETIQVIDEGRGADDPITYSGGWYSIRTGNDGKIHPWAGGTSEHNNAIREYSPETDTWTVIKEKTSSGTYDRGTLTFNQTAKDAYCSDPQDCLIHTGGDNHLHFYIPDRDETFIFGAAYTFVKFGGVFDWGTNEWTAVWAQGENVGDYGWMEPLDVPADNEDYAWHYNAPHAWVDPDGSGGDPGTGVVFSGKRFSSVTNDMLFYEPSDDPSYEFKFRRESGTTDPFPPAVGNNRNGGVAVGSCMYVFGGGDAQNNPTGQVWRYHLPTNTWKRMADMPAGSTWNAVAFDEATNRIVVLATDVERLYAYDVEEDTFEDISALVPSVSGQLVSQPAMAHAYGRYVVMARSWDADNDGSTNDDANATRNWTARFIVAAATYEKPTITEWNPPTADDDLRGLWPANTIKHSQAAVNTDTGEVFIFGGDYAGLSNNNSYRQEVFSWNPALDEPAVHHPEAWTREHEYCVPDGQFGPANPDIPAVTYDPTIGKFWHVEGLNGNEDSPCPTGTYYPYRVFTYDPDTALFDPLPKHTVGFYPNPQNGLFNGVVDTQDREIYKFSNVSMYKLDINNPTEWVRTDYANTALGGTTQFKHTRPGRPIGRYIYMTEYQGSTLDMWRFNLDTDEFEHLFNNTPGDFDQFTVSYGNRFVVSYPQPFTQGFDTNCTTCEDMWVFDTITRTFASVRVRDNSQTRPYAENGLIGCKGDDNICYGIVIAPLEDREELFVFGEWRYFQTKYKYFYTIDLSWLPGGTAQAVGTRPVGVGKGWNIPADAPFQP